MYGQIPVGSNIHINAMGSANSAATGIPDMPPSMGQQAVMIANPVNCRSRLEEFGFEPVPDELWVASSQHSTLHFQYHIRYDVKKEIGKYTRIEFSNESPNVVKYAQRIKGTVPKWDAKASTFTNWQLEVVAYYRERRVVPQQVAVQFAIQEGLSRQTTNTWIGTREPRTFEELFTILGMQVIDPMEGDKAVELLHTANFSNHANVMEYNTWFKNTLYLVLDTRSLAQDTARQWWRAGLTTELQGIYQYSHVWYGNFFKSLNQDMCWLFLHERTQRMLPSNAPAVFAMDTDKHRSRSHSRDNSRGRDSHRHSSRSFSRDSNRSHQSDRHRSRSFSRNRDDRTRSHSNHSRDSSRGRSHERRNDNKYSHSRDKYKSHEHKRDFSRDRRSSSRGSYHSDRSRSRDQSDKPRDRSRSQDKYSRSDNRNSRNYNQSNNKKYGEGYRRNSTSFDKQKMRDGIKDGNLWQCPKCSIGNDWKHTQCPRCNEKRCWWQKPQ